MYYCPNKELSQIYKDCFKELKEKFPDAFKGCNFKQPIVSGLVENDFFPSFEDFRNFFIERAETFRDKGIDPNDKEAMRESCYETNTYLYKDKIFASCTFEQEMFEETIVEIFNFFNGIFPNLYLPHMFFPDNLIYHWKTFDKVVIEQGPLEFKNCLLVGRSLFRVRNPCECLFGLQVCVRPAII